MKAGVIVRTVILASAIGFVFALSAGAADISGKWTAPATSPSGSPMGDRIFTFQVDGSTLTGSVMTQRTVNATFEVEGQPKMVGKLTTQSGDPTAISDGKISGYEVSFATISKMGPTEIKTTYQGTIAGNEIKFKSETPMPSGMPMMGAPAQAASGSTQGAQSGAQSTPQIQTQEFVAKRVNP